MPKSEHLPTIPAREALAIIARDVEKQRKAWGKNDRPGGLERMLLSTIKAFDAENIPIKTTIFLSPDLKVQVASSRLPEIDLNEASHEVSINGKNIEFLGKRDSLQWQLLLYFISHPDMDTDKSTLMTTFSRKYSEIKSGIQHLRGKIESNPRDPKILITVGPTDKRKYRLKATVGRGV